ncbi:MAG TPA: HIT domain-containing protein [Pseudomonadales bacterium]|jgi:diadenosine tetraphosphate (Ap4A) HIT family hydrolase|nr:HIT domain-containing protein [Cellvibrionales bacterium]HRG50077.1 HIT domain-containing protein [Pseudomonadales bacterium]
MFALHDQLQKDCTVIGNLPLSTLLLMNDANYPWFVLVPRREQVREWYELSEVDQRQLLQEANALAKFVQQKTDAKKMNIGALGNMVPQLHVHVIARFEVDAAWPAPVWGKAPAQAYTEGALSKMLELGRDFIAQ